MKSEGKTPASSAARKPPVPSTRVARYEGEVIR